MAVDFGGIGGGISSVFGALGDLSSAKGYKKAAAYSDLNAGLARESTAIQQYQQQRDLYQTIGGQQADLAGAGLGASGSALDLIRSSMAQGSLAKQLIGLQGEITATGYKAEAASYSSMASSAKKSGIGGLISGGLKIAAAAGMFSDDRLKENIQLVRRRPDGLGIYTFNFKGDDTRFEGLIASDVLAHAPDRVAKHKNGFYMIDYDGLGVVPRIV